MTSLDERRIPIIRTSPETQYARRLVHLAFLAPDLQKAIIEGTQLAGLNLDQLIGRPLPIEWEKQRKLFA